jgi:hypothetical protein
VRVLALRTAEHLARSRQLDAAARILENYIAVHGAEAEMLRRLGTVRLSQGRAREAAVLLERALGKHFESGGGKHAPPAAAPARETPPESITLSA